MLTAFVVEKVIPHLNWSVAVSCLYYKPGRAWIVPLPVALSPAISFEVDLLTVKLRIVLIASKGLRKPTDNNLQTEISEVPPSCHRSSAAICPLCRLERVCPNQFHFHLISDSVSKQFGNAGLTFYYTFCKHLSPYAHKFKSQLCLQKHTCYMMGCAGLLIPQKFQNIEQVYIKIE